MGRAPEFKERDLRERAHSLGINESGKAAIVLEVEVDKRWEEDAPIQRRILCRGLGKHYWIVRLRILAGILLITPAESSEHIHIPFECITNHDK